MPAHPSRHRISTEPRTRGACRAPIPSQDARFLLRPAIPGPLGRILRQALSVFGYAVLAGAVVFAALVVALRFYFLPNVGHFREPITAAVTRAVGQPVTIGALAGYWHGLHPRLSLRDVVVHDAQGRPGLRLERVDAVLSWRTVLAGSVRLRTLLVERPDLVVRRDRAGLLTVAGVPVRLDGPDSGFAHWVLAQSQVQIRDAKLTWIDEQRGAPPLELADVLVHLESRRRQHRIVLRARPTAEVGGLVDVRAEFSSGRRTGIAATAGRLHLHAPYLNLGAVRMWVDLPVVFESGAGEVEAWVDLGAGRPQGATVDLRAVGIVARLDARLDPIDIPAVQGRILWQRTPEGFDATARRLSIGVGEGGFLPAADIVVRRRADAPGRPGRIDVESERVDLAPLTYFAHRLPVPESLRAALTAHAPRGRVSQLSLSLETGAAGPGRYQLAARFDGLSMRGLGRIPGFSGAAGSVRADQTAGQLELDARRFVVDAPAHFEAPLVFDVVHGLLDWRLDGPAPVLQLQRLAFENPDVAGGAEGRVVLDPAQGPVLELKGALVRASVAAVPRYVPLVAGDETRAWLRSALVGGSVRDATVVVAGPLRAFPFPKDVEGRFEVRVPVSNAKFAIGPEWPVIDQLAGGVVFRGTGLQVDGAGAVLGARITATRVGVADLLAPDPTVEIAGEAQGAAAEFLRFVDASPVGGWIGGVAKGVKIDGAGRLKLSLAIPVHRVHDTKVAGTYQFAANRVEGLVGLPVLGRVTGPLEFTERGARLPGATADFLGMPVRFGVDVKADGAVVVEARGRAGAERLRDQFAHPLLARLAGDTDWRAMASVKGDRGEVSVESDLRGMAVDLPAPVGKAAAEIAPLRYQRKWRDAELTQSLTVADRVSLATVGAPGDAPGAFRRAAVDLGGGPPRVPERHGILVTGAWPRLDGDAWIAAIPSFGAATAGGGSGPLPAVGIDVRFGTAAIAGREFHEVGLKAQRRGSVWEGAVASREVKGRVDWYPAARGRVVAKLERLHLPEIPAAPPALATAPPAADPVGGHELPALDVTADSFRLGALDLGALILRAVPEGRTWQIEKLDLRSPDGHLTAEGGWQAIRGKPRTQLAVRVEASDIGGLLKRLGRPEGVSGGDALLTGVIEWAGNPYRIDPATLSGRLSLEAHRGRFTQLDPGMGKLFGILSLQALPRRIALDFRDVFSQGFAFDEIRANSTIEGGVMHTGDLRMSGSSAQVTMTGDIDLAHESQTLDVRIVPSVSDSIAIVGAAVVNPLAGLAALLLGKALGNPIDRAIAFEYHISGTWTDPVVTKGRKLVPPRPPQPVQAPAGRR